jgi:hypothetical protein
MNAYVFCQDVPLGLVVFALKPKNVLYLKKPLCQLYSDRQISPKCLFQVDCSPNHQGTLAWGTMWISLFL